MLTYVRIVRVLVTSHAEELMISTLTVVVLTALQGTVLKVTPTSALTIWLIQVCLLYLVLSSDITAVGGIQKLVLMKRQVTSLGK